MFTYFRDSDGEVYRQADEARTRTLSLEHYLDGEWKPARGELFPSEQDLLSMREISEAEAKRRLAA